MLLSDSQLSEFPVDFVLCDGSVLYGSVEVERESVEGLPCSRYGECDLCDCEGLSVVRVVEHSPRWSRSSRGYVLDEHVYYLCSEHLDPEFESPCYCH